MDDDGDISVAFLYMIGILELLKVVDDLLDGGDVGSLLFGDLAVEFLFDGHDEFDGVEGVGTEIIHEGGAGDDLVGIDAQLRDDDVLDLVLDGEEGRSGGGSAANEGGRLRGEGGSANGQKGGKESLLEHHGEGVCGGSVESSSRQNCENRVGETEVEQDPAAPNRSLAQAAT